MTWRGKMMEITRNLHKDVLGFLFVKTWDAKEKLLLDLSSNSICQDNIAAIGCN